MRFYTLHDLYYEYAGQPNRWSSNPILHHGKERSRHASEHGSETT